MGYKVMFLLRLVRGRSRIANQVYFHDFSLKFMKVKVSVTQSCPTLCDPLDCSPPDSCPWDFPGKDTGMSNRSFLQVTEPTPPALQEDS